MCIYNLLMKFVEISRFFGSQNLRKKYIKFLHTKRITLTHTKQCLFYDMICFQTTTKNRLYMKLETYFSKLHCIIIAKSLKVFDFCRKQFYPLLMGGCPQNILPLTQYFEGDRRLKAYKTAKIKVFAIGMVWCRT